MTDLPNPIDRINELRLKSQAGLELTNEEIVESIQLLRAQRKGVGGEQTEGKKTVPLDLNELFAK